MNSKSSIPMEKAQIETLKPSGTPSPFPPHRRRHLKSETFRTLVRLLSHCYDESQILPEGPNPDNGSDELGKSNKKEVCDQLVGPDSMESKNLLIHKETVVDESTDVIGFQDTGFSQAQMVTNELDHITRIKGNAELVPSTTINLSTSLADKNQTSNGVLPLRNNQESFDLEQSLMEEYGNAGFLRVDKGHYNCKDSEAIGLYFDKDMIAEILKPGENDQEDMRNAMEEVEHEMQQKEMELEKAVCTSSIMNSSLCMTAGGDIEEGEISDDFGVYNQPPDSFLEDVVALGEKVVEEQISEDIINKEEFTFNEQKGANEKDTESTSYFVDTVDKADDGIGVELKKSNRNVMEYKPKMVVRGKTTKVRKADGYDCMLEAGRHKKQGRGAKEDFDCTAASFDNLALRGEISEEYASENQGITSTEKDAGVCNKKKKGPLTKERKAKKKEKKRIKRAEKNRRLGVKRLKLHPVLKPKTVTYCRHYLKGRCQEGDRCKFSHDTIPLTKSKPCCHFARHSCMKGDDCPFDHQLSKYTCNNYVSKSFCRRGDNCMFSHEIPLKERSPSASNVCKPELKSPSLAGNSNFKKQLNINVTSHQNVNALSYSGVSLCKNKEQNVAETILKPPAQAPKGISFLSFGKSPLGASSKHKQASSSPKGNDGVKVGNQMNQTALDTIQSLNEMPKKTPPAVTPQGVNFLSFGKAPSDDSSSGKQASLLSHGDKGNEISVQERQSALDKIQNSTAMPWRLPVSPLTSGHSSDWLADGHKKITPSLSSQKALLSTLAFAAKYESEKKMDWSIGAPAVSTVVNNEYKNSSISGSSQNESIKASTILDFLFDVGSKSKK